VPGRALWHFAPALANAGYNIDPDYNICYTRGNQALSLVITLVAGDITE
jgi:hypothetical protein